MLSDNEIHEALKDGLIGIEPFSETQIRPANVSFQLGKEILRNTHTTLRKRMVLANRYYGFRANKKYPRIGLSFLYVCYDGLMASRGEYTKLDRTFQISLILKAIDSILEIVGGILLLIVSADFINSTVALLTRHELSQDPHDFVANHLLKATHDFATGSKYFAAFYLLSHGIVKIVIIIALFKEKMWAYPAMIIVLGAFIGYQLYRLSFKFSISLVLLTIFDIFVIWLTWQEYKKHRLRDAQKLG